MLITVCRPISNYGYKSCLGSACGSHWSGWPQAFGFKSCVKNPPILAELYELGHNDLLNKTHFSKPGIAQCAKSNPTIHILRLAMILLPDQKYKKDLYMRKKEVERKKSHKPKGTHL